MSCGGKRDIFQTAPTDVGPRRASGGGLRDPVARTGGCRGAREGLDPGKIRGAVSLSWPQTDPSNRFRSRHLAGSGSQHMQVLSCCVVILSTTNITLSRHGNPSRYARLSCRRCRQTKLPRPVSRPATCCSGSPWCRHGMEAAEGGVQEKSGSCSLRGLGISGDHHHAHSHARWFRLDVKLRHV